MPFSPDGSGVDRNVPTVAAGAGMGTAPPAITFDAASDDTRGSLSFGSGSVTGAGVIFTVTWSRPHDANRLPRVIIQEITAAMAGIDIAVTSVTSTGFAVSTNTRNLAASQAAGTYGLSYLVID